MPIYSLNCLLPPITLPIELIEVKNFLHLDHDDEDETLCTLIQAAVRKFETYTKKAVMAQQWRITYYQVTGESINLPIKPAIDIVKVEGINWNNSWRVISSESYVLEENSLYFNTISYYHRFRITYNAGMANSSLDVPPDIKAALLEHIGHLYEHRGNTDSAATFPMVKYDQFRSVNMI